MARRSGEEKLSAGSTAAAKRGACSALLVLAAAIAGYMQAGCNVVQGFQDAGDTLFPAQKTYLAAPGVHLVSGGYHSVDFAVGTDIYLFARVTDDTQGGLASMPYGNPHPCVIPSVGRYWASS